MREPFPAKLVEEGLRFLGKRRLVLSIHDGSFPSDASEETGRGTPYGRGGRELLRFARNLGFNGIQLGPQGQSSRGNPSPYDGTACSRGVLSIAPAPLARDPAWGGLLAEEELAGAVEAFAGAVRDRNRVQYELAFDTQDRLLRQAYQRWRGLKAGTRDRSRGTGPEALLEGLRRFRGENRAWLAPDALYSVLAEEHGSTEWFHWPRDEQGRLDRRLACPAPGDAERAAARRAKLSSRHREAIGFYEFCQFLAHRQHEELHREAGAFGLALYGDLQIGLSARDTWGLQPLFLRGYRLGAPPSRTNPAGQPWGYFVFDPAVYHRRGTAGSSVVEFLRLRVGKLFDAYDGLRIDHPQGLVCPWVYRSDDPDPLHAVQQGARLFSSPDLAEHPRLRRYAIARREQLDPDPHARRYHDGWVRALEPEQVSRYATLLALIVEAGRSHGRDTRDIACEILSTLPYPLARVMRLYDLGRFRVTQKASLEDPSDVYRSENAQPQDWIMMGNHDTAPMWRVVQRWRQNGEIRDRAAYLARRLGGAESVQGLRSLLARDPGRLVHAQLADALLSRAEQLLIFFADLFGCTEQYNNPGTVSVENWTLRVPSDYRSSYPERASRLEALNLPYALFLALRSRPQGAHLARRLAAASGVEHAVASSDLWP
jgi:4-alpha-glucanotransferase